MAAVNEWKAALVPAVSSDATMLYLWRPAGGGLVEYLSADATLKTAPEAANVPGAGLSLPRGAYAAIVEALRPDTTSGELVVLRESLKVERDRVDRVLEQRVLFRGAT